MKNLLVIALLGALVWFGSEKYRAIGAQRVDGPMIGASRGLGKPTVSRFACDGRTHCSQMRSCAEATYFIRHCPNTKMDGDHDGVPCERQWCY